MAYRKNLALVGIKAETTPGTFADPKTGDATGTPQIFAATDVSFDPEGEFIQRSDARSHFGKLPGVPGIGKGKFSFKLPLVGRTGAGTAPLFRLALMAAGFAEEVTASTSVIYRPASLFDGSAGGAGLGTRPAAAYSLVAWIDGKKCALNGCMGNVKLSAKAGQFIEAAFEFQGGYSSVTDEVMPTPSASTSFVPPTFLGAGLTLNFGSAWANAEFETLELDCGNSLSENVDANSAAGLKYVQITDRKASGKFNPLLVANSSHDFFGIWRAGTVGSLQTGVIGSVAGNRLQLIFPVIQYQGPKLGDRNSFVSVEQDFAIVTQVADTEGADFRLIFT